MSQQLHDGNDEGVVIGASTTAKVAFFGVDPVVQQANVADATAGDIVTQFNDLKGKLEALGLLASS